MSERFATLLVGLPGSGKTSYLSAHKFDAVFDDCVKEKNTPDAIKNCTGSNIVLSDPQFCDERIRQQAVEFLTELGYIVSFLFWENDPEQAIKNLIRRNDGRLISAHLVRELALKYHPVRVDFKVYRPSLSKTMSSDLPELPLVNGTDANKDNGVVI